MLYLVIERFTQGSRPVRDRFLRHGRMTPEGVRYIASWIDPRKERCYQVMEADSEALLRRWTERWADLVSFELVPVVASQEYWAAFDEEVRK